MLIIEWHLLLTTAGSWPPTTTNNLISGLIGKDIRWLLDEIHINVFNLT